MASRSAGLTAGIVLSFSRCSEVRRRGLAHAPAGSAPRDAARVVDDGIPVLTTPGPQRRELLAAQHRRQLSRSGTAPPHFAMSDTTGYADVSLAAVSAGVVDPTPAGPRALVGADIGGGRYQQRQRGVVQGDVDRHVFGQRGAPQVEDHTASAGA